MIILILILLSSCVSNIKTPVGTKNAILIEGLGSLPTVERAFKSDLEDMGYYVVTTNWKYRGPVKAKVCIVHSCGWMSVKDGCDCETLISLDARRCDSFKNTGFKMPQGVNKHIAIFQRSGLRGYPIDFANNYDFGGVGHMRLPSEAKSLVLKVIE